MQGHPAGAIPGYYPRSNAPRIGEWLSESFTLYGREWQTWTAQGAIFLFLVGGPVFIGYMAMYLVPLLALGSMDSSGTSSNASPLAVGVLVAGIGIFFVSILAAMVLASWIMAGMKHTAIKQLRGEPISVGDVWAAKHAILPLIGYQLLLSLITLVGFLLLCVPGIVFSFWAVARFGFAPVLIVEQRMGPIEAMKESMRLTDGQFWMYLLWFWLCGLIGGIGGSVCPLLLAATYPIMVLMWVISYRDIHGIPGALTAAPAPAPPTVPMGSYGVAGPATPAGPCPQCQRPVAHGALRCPSCGNPFPLGYQPPA